MRFKHFYLFSFLLVNILLYAGEPYKRLHLIFTNDIHGSIHQYPARFMNPEYGPMLTGGAGAYRYVNELRAEASQKGEYVLLLDGGNIFQGTPLGTVDGGERIIRWMNLMKYDAFTPGLRDFDQGTNNLEHLSDVAEFPMLSGNIIGESTGEIPKWLNSTIIKHIGETEIAIIGITADNLSKKTFPRNTFGLEFLPTISTAQKLVNQAKEQGADIIILLAHTGLPYNREEVFEIFHKMVMTSSSIETESIPTDLPSNSVFIPYDSPPKPIGGYDSIQKNVVCPDSIDFQGIVFVTAFIDEEGKATKIKSEILEGNSESGLNEAAEEAMRKTEWEPAKQRDRNVGVWITIPFHFGSDASSEYKQARSLTALTLAHFLEGVDVIVTGGVAKGYDYPWEDPKTHTLVVQNYGNLSGIGHLELLIDDKAKTLVGHEYPTDRGMLITLLEDDILADLSVAETIKNWVIEAKKIYYEDRSIYSTLDIATGSCDAPLRRLSTSDKFSIPNLGKPERLEIVTWNLEWFPTAGDSTLEAVAEVIQEWGVDIVALQEIKNIHEFGRLMEFLPDHGYVLSEQSSFMDQAIIYRKDVITFLGQYESFSFDDYYFAGRPPLMADFVWSCGDIFREFSVINMHLKCCDDGLFRRQKSMVQLHDLVRQYIEGGNENIVVVGDWNDQLTDTGILQSFTAFLDDQANFQFATMEIAQDTSQASYPKWTVPSTLDHILFSKGFFDEHESGGITQTLDMEQIIGDWDTYENILSDHLPVIWSIEITSDQAP